MINKICKKCLLSLPATKQYFYQCAGNKDRLMGCCKFCQDKQVFEWKEKNKNQALRQKRVHYQKKKEAAGLKYKARIV